MHNHLSLGQIVGLLSAHLGWTTLLNTSIASERTNIGIARFFIAEAAKETSMITVDIRVTSTTIHLIMHRFAWATLSTSLSPAPLSHIYTTALHLFCRTIHDGKSTIILADI